MAPKHFRTLVGATRKPAKEIHLPRSAEVTIWHWKDDGKTFEPHAKDHVNLNPNHYDYLLEILRNRIKEIEHQTGWRIRPHLREEREFAVNLICHLDI